MPVGHTGFTNIGTGVALAARSDGGIGLIGFSKRGGVRVLGEFNTDSGLEATGTNGVHGHGGNGVYGVGTEYGVQAPGGTFGVFAQGNDHGTPWP